MKNIVLLGSSGFLGTSILKKLDTKKFTIKTLSHKQKIPFKFNPTSGSILSKSVLNNLIQDGDFVINLTGQFSSNLKSFFQINLNGNLNLLNILKNKKNIKLILISTTAVYGDNPKSSIESDKPKPHSIYGMTKFLTEQLCEKFSKENNLDITILRISNLYGPNKKDGIITNLLKSTNSKNPISLNHNGDQIRDFLFVDDAADGIIQSIKYFKPGFQIFNISTGIKYSIKDVIREIKKTDLTLNFKTSISKPDEFCNYANNFKSKKFLHFKPKTSFQKGLKLTIDNFLNN